MAGQADQGAPERQAEDEGAGAVDRVDDPAIVRVRPDGAELLAKDAVGGIGLGQSLPDGGFSAAVGRGDRVEGSASFVVNFLFCPEMRQYDRTCNIGQGVGFRQQGLEFKLFGIGHR